MDSHEQRKSLDRIYDSIVKGINKSKSEVVKLTRVGKIKLELVNTERRKTAKLEELGILTYDLLKNGNLQFNEDFLGKIEEIEKIDAEISVYESMLEELNLAESLSEFTPDTPEPEAAQESEDPARAAQHEQSDSTADDAASNEQADDDPETYSAQESWVPGDSDSDSKSSQDDVQGVFSDERNSAESDEPQSAATTAETEDSTQEHRQKSDSAH